MVFGPEKSEPFLWLILNLFVAIGGVADILSDCVLLVDGFIIYFSGTEGFLESNFYTFLRLMVILTEIIPFTLWVLMSGTLRIQDVAIGAIGFFFAAALMKVGFLCLRIYFLCYIFYQVYLHRFLSAPRTFAMHRIHLMEFLFLYDFLFSAFPLGVLALFEIFLPLEGEAFAIDAWELTKLIALLVDCIGLSAFVWFHLRDYFFEAKQRVNALVDPTLAIQTSSERSPLLASIELEP